MNVNELIEVKELRKKLVTSVEVLDMVKELLLLLNTDCMTTKMVADYYEVSKEAVSLVVKDHRGEVALDGYNVLVAEELKSLKDSCEMKSRTRAVVIFPKRAILRIGMLLRDSEIAKEVRTQLLNIVEKVEDKVKVADIEKE